MRNRTANLDELMLKNGCSRVKSRFDMQDIQRERAKTEDCRLQVESIGSSKSRRQDQKTKRI